MQPTPSSRPRGVHVFRSEMRFWWNSFWHPFKWSFLVLFVLWTLAGLPSLLSSERGPEEPLTGWLLLPVFTAMMAGAMAAIVGVAAWIWRLVGGWIIVPVVTIPLFVGGIFWLAGGLLEAQGQAYLAALEVQAHTHEYRFLALAPAHGGGAALLVLLAPLLLIDAAAILLHPSVALELAILALEVLILFAVALMAAAVLSALVLVRAYTKRFRRRHAAPPSAPAQALT